MDEISQVLQSLESGLGDEAATGRLLPLVYEELRRLAARQMAREPSDHTLQSTALVHEAYLRLVDSDSAARQSWKSRSHFFGAAAEAMRRILVDHARRRRSLKRGGDAVRATWNESQVGSSASSTDDVLAVDEALTRLGKESPELAHLAKLRYFAGMTVPETAAALGVSPSTVDRQWAAARAWLIRDLTERP